MADSGCTSCSFMQKLPCVVLKGQALHDRVTVVVLSSTSALSIKLATKQQF